MTSTARKGGPTFYTVPAGTRASECNGPHCHAVVYWRIRNPGTGRPLLIDCDVDGGETPSEQRNRNQGDLFTGTANVHDGRGVSHFATCPDADHFNGRASKR